MEALSVVIMTFNEADNIERCIRSVQPIADEIIVVDSYSTDQTPALAAQAGARVVYHPFENFRAQRKFCLEVASHDFVLALDADEWVSRELREAILGAKQHRQFDAYTFKRLNGIAGRWMYYGGWYPDIKLRLGDRRCLGQGDSTTHDELIPLPAASVGSMEGYLYHRTNADFHDRMLTVNKLSTMAAHELAQRGKRGHWSRVLLKPPFRFFQELILRRGFRDGFYGWALAGSSAIYVFLREIKLLEQQRQLARPLQDDYSHRR
ncbi:MAG: glycosyltransferase family 2 protein [Lewinellaceae bacterium]|nr:glycosyltransferase family 2 protein [Lewinellaceae bacterium]